MASGSAPSTSNCRPLRAYGSGSASATPSRPSRPSLRAVSDQLTTRSIPPARSIRGGKRIQRTICSARLKALMGDCSKAAARVPPITISAAGPLSSADR
ncbi:hypothetical protein D3C80_1552910 [compost metagenome]